MNAELKRKRIETWVKVAIICTFALIVSPIIFMVVEGLIGLLVAGTIGLAAITFAPWMAMKFANWKLKAIKHEAHVNPVPTLQNQLVDRRKAQVSAKERLDASAASLQLFRQKAERLKREHPHEAAEFEKTVALLDAAQKEKVRKYMVVDNLNDQFEKEIEKAAAIWDVTQSMIEAKKAMGLTLNIDPMEKIKAETAIDSIQLSLAQATSDLEMSLAEEGVVIDVTPERPALEYNPGWSPSDIIKQKEKVRR